MLILLSPSKTLDESPLPDDHPATTPRLRPDADQLAGQLRDLTPQELQSLMGISERLAALNHRRYLDYAPSPEAGKPALRTFNGDVYRSLPVARYTPDDLAHAQDRVRILSGLYGLLRPLDRVQPYRLEMGTRLANPRGDNLYDFWGDRITDLLNDDLDALPDDEPRIVLNLASNEYFRAVNTEKLRGRLVKPVFKEWKRDRYKVIAIYAKRARGAMMDWIIRERVDDLEGLRDFEGLDYRWSPDGGDGEELFLRRREP